MQYEFRALQAERLVEVEAAKERYGMNEVNFRVTMLEYKRLFTTKALLHRLLIGASAQALQQWTGINASESGREVPSVLYSCQSSTTPREFSSRSVLWATRSVSLLPVSLALSTLS